VALQDGQVTFRYRDRRRGNAKKVLTSKRQTSFSASSYTSYLRLRPRPTLPPSPIGVAPSLAQARLLLASPAPPSPGTTPRESWQDLLRRLTGRDPDRCPYCERGTLRIVASIPPPQDTRGP
jgi:hypothetical protein